jgi:CubicO group peptidase (beta-lactamase class C family)
MYRGFRGDEDGVGFGLAVEVTLEESVAVLRRSVGSAGWNGAFGTISWHDPREGLVAVLMVQQSSAPLRADFANAVLQAVTESAPAR